VRILVVEDEPRLASLLRRGLTEEAHAVDLAADGEEALAWVDVGDYDAIVLDIMLPGIDGGLPPAATTAPANAAAVADGAG